MIKNVTFMAFSTLFKLMTGVLLFVFMARAWGVERFGEFVYPFTLASLIAIVVDYGFALQVVRDIGRDPARTDGVMREAIAAKALLAALVCIPSLAYLAWVGPGHGTPGLFFLLLVAAILNSFALLLNLPLRSLNRFGQETRIVAVASAAHFVLVGTVLVVGGGLGVVASVFVGTRLIYLALSISAYGKAVKPLGLTPVDYRGAYSAVRRGLPFGLFVALGTAYFQVDTVLVQKFLGAEAVGFYQAGVRLLLAALVLPEVLCNVYLPAMAAVVDRPSETVRLGMRLTRHLLMLGALGLAALVLGAEWLVRLTYGEGYDRLSLLLPSFGVVLLFRFGASALGLLLTVSGRQTARTVVVAAALAVSVASNLVLIPRYGLAGAVNAAIITHVLLFVGYAWVVGRERGTGPLDHRSWALVALALLVAAVGPQHGLAVALIALGTVSAALALGVRWEEWRGVLATVARVYPSRRETGDYHL